MSDDTQPNAEISWFVKLLKTQGLTFFAIVFMCGGLYFEFNSMSESLKELKDEMKLVRELDKSNDNLKIRIKYLEDWKYVVDSRLLTYDMEFDKKGNK